MDEIWRPIPSLPEYLASSLGRVMCLPKLAETPHGGSRHYGGEPTKGVLSEGRYQITSRGKTYRIHRLICEAFAGEAPFQNAVVMHLNEDSTDNRSENLAWGTQKENLAAPGFRAYLRRRSTRPKINAEQARHIKYGGMSASRISAEYGISKSTVSNIRNGRAWKHI